MIDVTIKKLWNGHASLRSNWIKTGIDRGGLLVKYKGQSMSLPILTLKKLLQSKPSLYIKSNILNQIIILLNQFIILL